MRIKFWSGVIESASSLTDFISLVFRIIRRIGFLGYCCFYLGVDVRVEEQFIRGLFLPSSSLVNHGDITLIF